MSVCGKFILLTAANSFLGKDYDYCMQICKTNFTRVTGSSLFDGNLQRFKALSLMSIVNLETAQNTPMNKYYLNEKIEKVSDHKLMISKALRAIKQSADIFSKCQTVEKSGEKHLKNYHGLALAEFMSGYLYANYMDILSEPAKEDTE